MLSAVAYHLEMVKQMMFSMNFSVEHGCQPTLTWLRYQL
jgi:hypothetical protein